MTHKAPMEIQRADPKARRTALLIVGGAAGLALLAYLLMPPLAPILTSFIEAHAADIMHKPTRVIGVGLVLMLPIIACAIYLFFLGARIVAAQQSPLPEQRVVKDTPIHEGRSAVIRGRVAQVLAAVLLFASIGMPVLFWLMLKSISVGAT